MKKLSFLQAYEKHIDKVKKHGLTIASVLTVGVVGSLGYQGYQDASFAKAIANKELLQDMGFVNINTTSNSNGSATSYNSNGSATSYNSNGSATSLTSSLLTGTYTGGDIIISAASFTQTLPNGTVGPVNTILSTGTNAPLTVNITFKNIGSTPLYIWPSNINGDIGQIDIECQGPSIGGGCGAKITVSSLNQGRYLLPGQSIQGTINTIDGSWFLATNSANSINQTIKFTVYSQQQQQSSSPNPNNLYSIFETNGQNNTFTINYTVPSTPTPVSNGIAEPVKNKGFDLTIQDITSTYNQQTDKIRYTMTIKNIGNVGYNFIQGTPWAGLMSNIYPENFGLMENLSSLGGNNDHLNMDTTTPVLGSVVGINTKCNTFKVGILYSLNGTALLPGDRNISNNTVEKCTTFTKTNGTNPPTGSGNTYGYGYGYQPGYGYGYGYGYKTKYTDKSNFFYLTKPYMMISERIYKVFKDQHKVMKKLTKGAVEKLFDKSTLKTMRTDVMKYLKKEINKAQNKTRGMKEKVAEIQKISKLYTQFTKDYDKLINSKESAKTYTKPIDTKKEATKTYIKPTDTKKEDTKTYDNVYGYKKTTK